MRSLQQFPTDLKMDFFFLSSHFLRWYKLTFKNSFKSGLEHFWLLFIMLGHHSLDEKELQDSILLKVTLLKSFLGLNSFLWIL